MVGLMQPASLSIELECLRDEVLICGVELEKCIARQPVHQIPETTFLEGTDVILCHVLQVPIGAARSHRHGRGRTLLGLAGNFLPSRVIENHPVH